MSILGIKPLQQCCICTLYSPMRRHSHLAEHTTKGVSAAGGPSSSSCDLHWTFGAKECQQRLVRCDHAHLLPVSSHHYDAIFGADGKQNSLPGFRSKEFRAKLALAITANFVNSGSKPEASVPEISGVAYVYNQDFFNTLAETLGIELENIVYYKDETHYFVMTAKKPSLLKKGVIKKASYYDNTTPMAD